jgi:diadenosine tetraphosphate (Ap4A) HIT family hydrolase
MIDPTPSPNWELDPRLARHGSQSATCRFAGRFFSKDANYPWLLLVPRRPYAVELSDLDTIEQTQLIGEIAHAGRTLKALTSCDKINVAALGNVVAQLHVHVIARSRSDAAWPRPVWNAVLPRDYDKNALDKLLTALRRPLTAV